MPLPAQDPLIAFAPAPRVPTEVLDGLCHREPATPDPPGPTGIRRDNPRMQGEIGLGDAVGWFTRRGMTVSIPLADDQPYDLVVEVDDPALVDLVFVVTDDGGRYVVPAAAITATRSITLGAKWARFRSAVSCDGHDDPDPGLPDSTG